MEPGGKKKGKKKKKKKGGKEWVWGGERSPGADAALSLITYPLDSMLAYHFDCKHYQRLTVVSFFSSSLGCDSFRTSYDFTPVRAVRTLL